MNTKITATQLAELIRILYDSKNAGSKSIRDRYIGEFILKNEGLRPTLNALCNMHDHVEPVPPAPVKVEEPVKAEDPTVYSRRKKND